MQWCIKGGGLVSVQTPLHDSTDKNISMLFDIHICVSKIHRIRFLRVVEKLKGFRLHDVRCCSWDLLHLHNTENKANLPISCDVKKLKSFRLRWRFTSSPGADPLDPAGALPPDPCYRLVLHGLAMEPPFVKFLLRHWSHAVTFIMLDPVCAFIEDWSWLTAVQVGW